MFPEKLEEAQQILLDTVWQGYQRAEEWPKYFYVEAVLDQHDLDAEQVIASLPVIGGRLSGSSAYGLVRPTFIGPTRPQAGAPVPLTLAGLSYIAGASSVVQQYFALLDVMALARRRAVFDPVHETVVQISSSEMNRDGRMDQDDLQFLGLVAQTEPATASYGMVPDGELWAITVGRSIKHFAGVRNVGEYLDRIAALFVEPETVEQPRYASPLELAASLDYLNVVWMLRFGKKKPLLRLFSAERCSKLGLDAGTREEYYARLTALAEIIKDFDAPGVAGIGGHPLPRMKGFLLQELSAPNEERIKTALSTLDAIRVLRDSGQHNNAHVDAAARLKTFGLKFPVADWSEAWAAISAAAIDAIDALRDEISLDEIRQTASAAN